MTERPTSRDGPSPPTSASTDMENAYHVLLGRAPEESAVLCGNAHRTGLDIAREFVNSEEFDHEVARQIIEGRLLEGERYTGQPELSLRLWIGEFLPVSAKSRQAIAQARQWPLVLEALFSDTVFENSIDVKSRNWTLRELAARLGGAKCAWMMPQSRESY